MIKILLDQNIPAEAVQWLQEEVGSEAEILSTRMLGVPRMTDAESFRYCQYGVGANENGSSAATRKLSRCSMGKASIVIDAHKIRYQKK